MSRQSANAALCHATVQRPPSNPFDYLSPPLPLSAFAWFIETTS